jgi:Stage II sporulation protein E (SpoIIE)
MISTMNPYARSCIAAALLGVVSILCARAQVVDFQNERAPMVEIHGLWHFHTGDDPDGKLGWANPTFDDSKWQLLHSDESLNAQSHPGDSGMSWYRFRVALPANQPPMSLYIPGIGYCASYQVFADGRLIGQLGGLPPHERVYWANCSFTETSTLGQVMPIPAGAANGNGSVAIAIRVWRWRDWASINPTFEAFSIGETRLINQQWQLRWDHLFWSNSANNALLLGYLLAAIAGFGLFLLRPGEGEYLWFAGFELLNGAGCALGEYPVFHPMWFQGFQALQGLQLFLAGACVSMFFVTLLKERRGRLFWSMIGSALFLAVMFVPVVMQWMNAVVWIPVIYLSAVPFIACQLLLLSMAARRGNLDARLLLGPFSLGTGATLGEGLIFGLQAFGLGGSFIAICSEKWYTLTQWPFPIGAQNIADFLTQISILAILMLRFARTRRDEERFKGELEAARTVQQVLIPEEVPSIPGLALECVYRPASQVGGDFFQILPTPNNGALIVIGDVSGKGMPAAMAVSLLVGTVRTLAHCTKSPAEILTAMNLRMLGRSKDGFTTCLVLLLDQDGNMTLANAGHLAPYQGSNELVIESGLPLGLSAEAEYIESAFHLGPGEELTLETDGVAEARGKTGELFGFERAASISILSAQHIAATAAAFGQQDDITVLKIRRHPVLEPAGVPLIAVPPTSADNALAEGFSASE